ncbi:MAG: hypothetical protein IT481_01715 [Gammaproteobacteria bacterium]|nr:hypothetical protein [Gammaproteobacteria bacterium]
MVAALAVAPAAAVVAATPVIPDSPASPLDPATTGDAATFAVPTARGPCLAATRNGYLRARLRGALDLDLAWDGATMQCEGGSRPDGHGLRVTLAGEPRGGSGRRLRFVFGIDDVPEGASARARPTNVTLIFEGEQRLFATRGDDKCTTDELRQERIGALGGPRRSWRVVARGFCVAPATTLAGDARLLLTSFDFAAEVSYEEDTVPPADATEAGARR